ncbi:MAG TPA: cellulase family glycosylhydrolase [Candidatus Hydrogenedentes bacterium]|nr:cellulase family glycosylhydrolase [Candidatus Hydrogenedentota bacterium]
MRQIHWYAILARACFVTALVVIAAPAAEAQGPRPARHPLLEIEPVPSGVGVNIHFYAGNEHDLRMLEECGPGIIRMDISRAGAEKSPGAYDFSHYDRLVADMEARGIRILFIIDYGSPLYDDGLAPRSEGGRAAYARFCSALAAHFAGKPIIWELWNEPNLDFWKPEPNVEDYLAWCKVVVPAIREADPGACIVGPATSGFPWEFLQTCFENRYLDLVDGVSVHPYRGSFEGPETARRDYDRLAAMIDRYKTAQSNTRDIPILSGEWGYTTTNIPRDLQGVFLPRQWLSNLAHGIPISIWYDWHDDGQDPDEREHNFGTVTWDYQPKPAYTAMKTLIAELKGYTPAGTLPMGRGSDFVAVFRKDSSYKLAIWTTEESSELTLPEGLNVIRAIDHHGQPVDVPPDGVWRVSGAPVYLTLSPEAPPWLGILPLQPGPIHPAKAGTQLDVSIPFSATCSAPDGLELSGEVTSIPGIEGHWLPNSASLVPGTPAQLIWKGTITRRDAAEVSVPVAITCRGREAGTHTFRMNVRVPVANPIKMTLGWRHDGLCVELHSQSDLPLTGQLLVKAGVQPLPAVPVELKGNEIRQIPFPNLTLSDGPQTVSAQMLHENAGIIAEVTPLTYVLVDAIDEPAGLDAREAYRLWDEGEENREITLAGEVIESPGDAPPFPKSVRVGYAVEPGWCFWQWGPQKNLELPASRPSKMMLWVHGPAFTDHMLCRIVDAAGQSFKTAPVSKARDGWELIELSLDKPVAHWGGAGDGVMHPPFRWTSYYLQESREARSGTTCLTGVVLAWAPEPAEE